MGKSSMIPPRYVGGYGFVNETVENPAPHRSTKLPGIGNHLLNRLGHQPDFVFVGQQHVLRNPDRIPANLLTNGAMHLGIIHACAEERRADAVGRALIRVAEDAVTVKRLIPAFGRGDALGIKSIKETIA